VPVFSVSVNCWCVIVSLFQISKILVLYIWIVRTA